MFSTCPPEALAAVWHADHSQAQQRLDQIKSLWAEVVKVDEASAGGLKSLSTLARDLHWAYQPLVQESMVICEKHRWDAQSREIRLMVWEQHAALSDTKRVLEDVFACLKDATRQNKNSKINRFRGYWEASTAKILHPEVREGSDPASSLEIPDTDWSSPLLVPVSRMEEGIFNTVPSKTLDRYFDVSVFLKGPKWAAVPWKPAGPHWI